MGIAWGAVSFACALALVLLPHDMAIGLFNVITHGVDWGPMLQPVAWWKLPAGVLVVFIMGWLFGLVLAATYNMAARSTPPQGERQA